MPVCQGLTVLDDDTIEWLLNSHLPPRSSATKQWIKRTALYD